MSSLNLQSTNTDLTEGELVMKIVDIVIRSISLIGCISMIVIIFLLKFHKDYVGRMLIFLTLSGLIVSMPLYTVLEDASSCTIAAIIENYGFISLAAWATCFAVELMLVLSAVEFNHRKAFIIYLLVCHSVPGVFAAITLISPIWNKNNNDEDCWIKLSDNKLRPYEIIPVCLFACVALVLAILSRRKLRILKQHIHVSNENIFGIMMQIPVYFLILWTPAIIIKILTTIYGTDLISQDATASNFWCICAMLPNLQPLIMTLGFVFSARVRHGLQKLRGNKKLGDGEPRIDATHAETILSQGALDDSTTKERSISNNELAIIDSKSSISLV